MNAEVKARPALEAGTQMAVQLPNGNRFLAPVDHRFGQYVFVSRHRFHIRDDRLTGAPARWREPHSGALFWVATEADEAAAAIPVDLGHPEPTELW